ncbi:MAG: acyltransferase, partial [Ilumatobacter sp.]
GRRALSNRPLVALGRISYGVYLVHWPVFVYLDEARTGSSGWNLALTRIGVTAVIALAMYVVLERPIRRSARPASVGIAVAAAMCASLLVVTTTRLWIDAPRTVEAAPVVLAAPADNEPAESTSPVATVPDAVTQPTPAPSADVGRAGAGALAPSEAGPEAGAEASDAVVSTSPTVPEQPTTIAVFGDSVPAWMLRDAAFAFARRDVVLVNGANEACDGAVGLPAGRDRWRNELPLPSDCLEWTDSYPVTLGSYERPIEIGLLVIGQAPAVDRYVDERWTHPCESESWYLDDVRNRIEYLRSQDVEPVLALPARYGKGADFILPDDYDARIRCVRTSLAALAFEQQVDTVDLDGLLCFGDDCNGRRRRDGIHVDPEVAIDVLNELVDLTLAAR